MRKYSTIVYLAATLLAITTAKSPAPEALIQAHVFLAAISSEKPGPAAPMILSASSDPRLSASLFIVRFDGYPSAGQSIWEILERPQSDGTSQSLPI